jgi:hypothetical protein
MVFFLLLLEKKKMSGESVWKTKGQKQEGKSGSQKWKGRTRAERKAPSLPFSAFFFFMDFFLLVFFFLFFCLKRRRCQEKAFETKGQKWKGRMRAWRIAPSLLCIFFLLYGFFFFVCVCVCVFFLLEEKEAWLCSLILKVWPFEKHCKNYNFSNLRLLLNSLDYCKFCVPLSWVTIQQCVCSLCTTHVKTIVFLVMKFCIFTYKIKSKNKYKSFFKILNFLNFHWKCYVQTKQV